MYYKASKDSFTLQTLLTLRTFETFEGSSQHYSRVSVVKRAHEEKQFHNGEIEYRCSNENHYPSFEGILSIRNS